MAAQQTIQTRGCRAERPDTNWPEDSGRRQAADDQLTTLRLKFCKADDRLHAQLYAELRMAVLVEQDGEGVRAGGSRATKVVAHDVTRKGIGGRCKTQANECWRQHARELSTQRLELTRHLPCRRR